MKVFFDTNVYVAEAILGQAAERMVEATQRASWRIYVNDHVLDEVERVLTTKLGFAQRFTVLTQNRITHRAALVDPGAIRHAVSNDANGSPILSEAIAVGANYLVTNDRHLLALKPYGLRIVSMNEYQQILIQQGLLT